MRNRSPANSAASSPPVPARISRMASWSSIASFGISASWICCSSLSLRACSAGFSASASLRISASVCGVGGERFEVGDLGGDRAIGLDRLDHGAELGEFARQLDVASAAQVAGQLAFHECMAGEQGIEPVLRQRDQSCNPSAAAKPSSLWRIDTLPTGCSRNGKMAVSPLRQSRSSSSALTGPTADGDSDSER